MLFRSNYITGVLCNNKMTTATDISDYKIVTKEVKPLCVFVKLDTIEYVLGANGVVKNGRKSFCISDLDMYHRQKKRRDRGTCCCSSPPQ